MSSSRFQPRARSLHSAKKSRGWDTLTKEEETDPHKISKRMKQLNFGYNTAGYQRYIASVPKDRRKDSDPTTPNPKWKWSARGWSAAVASWRVLLHKYDPPPETGVIDISGSLKRITSAIIEGKPAPWDREAVKFKDELATSARQAGSQAAVHSLYRGVQPQKLMQADTRLVCVPMQASAAVSTVSAALRGSAKRPREAPAAAAAAGGSADDSAAGAKAARKT